MIERPATDEREQLLNATEVFARSLNIPRPQPGKPTLLDREAFRRCGEFGLLGLPVPASHGGSEQSSETIAQAMMAFGRGCRDNGFVFSVNAHLWAFTMPLLRFGTPAQKDRYLRGAVQGEVLGAHAVTEPGAGSDAMAMRTRARREGTTWILNGSKTFITNGPSADAVIVFATIDPGMKAAGITAFIVDRDTPGLTLGPAIPKAGLSSSPMGEVFLDDCRVPDTQRLGAIGVGTAIFNHAMDLERTFIFASHVGAMERLLSDCIRYAQERTQFGVPLAKHAEITRKLVDMRVSVEASRLLVLNAAKERDAHRPVGLAAAVAKLFVSEAHVRHAIDAVQIHGASGITEEVGIARELTDAVPGTLYSGTSEMQRRIIARWMGLS